MDDASALIERQTWVYLLSRLVGVALATTFVGSLAFLF